MDRPAKWYGLPAGAAGALVFAWRIPDALAAVRLIAVTDVGVRVRWFVRRDRLGAKVMTLGARSGAVFEARPGTADGTLHVAEGELDALALAIAPWTGPVALHGDGDRAGRGAGLKVAAAIRDAGRECRIERCGPDEDPTRRWPETWVSAPRSGSTTAACPARPRPAPHGATCSGCRALTKRRTDDGPDTERHPDAMARRGQ